MPQRPMAPQLRRWHGLCDEMLHTSAANLSLYSLSTQVKSDKLGHALSWRREVLANDSLGYLCAALDIDLPSTKCGKGNASKPSHSSVDVTASSSSPPMSAVKVIRFLSRRYRPNLTDSPNISPHPPLSSLHRCRMNTRLQCDLVRKIYTI